MNQWVAHVEFTSCNSYLTIAIIHHSVACILVLSACTLVYLKKDFKNMHFNNQSDILQKAYIYSTWTHGPKQKSAFKILWHLVKNPVFSIRSYVRKV